MEILAAGSDEQDLQQYSELFAQCFPTATHLRAPYLRWLYRDNPAGRMIGFNARVDDRLAAHYACIPVSVRIAGVEKRAMLSLNTATHPDYQGRGLFTRLAEATYAAAAAKGVEVAFGAANANSTPGFVRKLGFQLAAPLDSWVGVGRLGRIDWQRACADADFSRSWPDAELRWRMSNPANPIRSFRLPGGGSGFSAETQRFPFHAWAELPRPTLDSNEAVAGFLSRPRVFLGAFPRGCCKPRYFALPSRFRPSPLNFIVKGLSEQLSVREDGLLVTFLDFDAF